MVVGEGFGFDISYEVHSYESGFLYVFFHLKTILQFMQSVFLTFRLGNSSTCFMLEALEFVLGGVPRTLGNARRSS